MAEKPATPAELARATERVEAAFVATGKRLERLIHQRGVVPVRRLIEQAMADLERKIVGLGKPGETFTEVQRQAILAQYRALLVQLEPRMTRTLGEASREAQEQSIRDLVKLVAVGEAAFEGVVTPLPLEQAARMAGIIDKDRASLLRQHGVSVRTYGIQSIGEMETVLSQSFAQGMGYAETVSQVLDYVDSTRYRAERIVRTECLLGETRVSGAMVRAVHRRAYSGPVVEIVTAGGRKFTTTPNHPMLTRRGWVGSASLREGDDLVCDGGQEDFGSTSNEDVAGRPATIGEIFDALSTVGVSERMRTAQPDFHGDGMDGEVDIRRSLGTLRVGRFTPLQKPFSEHVFAPSDSTVSLFCGSCGGLLPVNQLCGVCDPANRSSGSANAKLNTFGIEPESFSQLLGRFSGHVSTDDLLVRKIRAIPGVRTSSSVEVESGIAEISRDSSLANGLENPVLRTTETLTDSDRGKAVQVQTDRILSLRVRQFSGHVFNLTTEDGYFSVDGAYTGNCSFAYNATHATAIDDASELVDGLMRRWTEYVNDQTGAPLDGRVANDSLVLHGQVCFQPEGATFEPRTTFLLGGTGGFTMPPDRRVNAKLWGRRYAHPPNRPNDRSRLVPWKPTWAVPAYMVVNGQRMDVRKALQLMKGAQADEVLDVAEGEPIPEQTLAPEAEVRAAREAFARGRQPKQYPRPAKTSGAAPQPRPSPETMPRRLSRQDEALILSEIEPRRALPAFVPPPTTLPAAPTRMTRKQYGEASLDYVKSLTSAERNALAAYSEARYIPINRALRTGVEIPEVDNARETARLIDAALAKAKPIEKPMILERGLSHIFRNDEKVQLKVGDEYIDPAYVSTTATQFQRLTSLFRRKDIHMRITVPAGVRVGFISAADPVRGKALLKSETEALLPRGLRFRVTSVKRKGPLKQLVDVEVVPE